MTDEELQDIYTKNQYSDRILFTIRDELDHIKISLVGDPKIGIEGLVDRQRKTDSNINDILESINDINNFISNFNAQKKTLMFIIPLVCASIFTILGAFFIEIFEKF